MGGDFPTQDETESLRDRKRYGGTRACTFGDFANDELAGVSEREQRTPHKRVLSRQFTVSEKRTPCSSDGPLKRRQAAALERRPLGRGRYKSGEDGYTQRARSVPG